MKIIGILLIASGIISICGSIFNRDSFFRYYKAQRLVSLFGKNGARIIYGLIGIFAIVGGVSLILLGHL